MPDTQPALFALLVAHPALFVGGCAVLGLLVGSFLNVVAYRLPIMFEREQRRDCADLARADEFIARGEKPPPVFEEAAPSPPFNLVVPRSACPKCHASITALQNIPVVSWLVLGGKCANCKTPISKRYPLVELFTGIASALVAWRFGFGLLACAGLFFTWMLIALTLIDLDTFYLPDSLTQPLMWTGLLLSISAPVWAPGATPLRPVDSIIGAVAGFMILWTFNALYKLVRHREGMGGGDFKLLSAFGAWFGWKMLLPILLFASLVGSVIGLYVMYRQRKGFNTEIPFGPYLAAAGWLFMLVGHDVVAGYMAMAMPAR